MWSLSWEELRVRVAGHDQSAASEGHQRGDFFRAEDMGDAFLIAVGAPVEEVLLVVCGLGVPPGSLWSKRLFACMEGAVPAEVGSGSCCAGMQRLYVIFIKAAPFGA